MEPEFKILQNIEKIAHLDLEKYDLIPKDTTVLIQKRASCVNAKNLEEVIKKIHQIVESHPALFQDTKAINHLITLSAHIYKVSPHSYKELKNLIVKWLEMRFPRSMAIDSLNHISRDFNDNYDAKEYLDIIKRCFLHEIKDIRLHPAYRRVSSKGVESLLKGVNRGTYVISPGPLLTQITLSYRGFKKNRSLEINRTLDGGYAYLVSQQKILQANSVENLITRMQLENQIDPALGMIPIDRTVICKEELIPSFQSFEDRMVVFPEQFLPFLSRDLSNDTISLQEVARCLCREVNKMAANLEKYAGRSRRLARCSKKYSFSIDGEKKLIRIYNLNFDCWLEMSQDGKTVQLLIIPPTPVAQGAFKIIYPAHQLTIALNANKNAVSHQMHILIRPNETNQVTTKERNEEVICWGIQAQQVIQSLLKGRIIFLSPLPRKRLPSANPFKIGPSEWEREWLNCAFDYVINHSCVPFDLLETKRKHVSIFDKLKILGDVALTLFYFHQIGFVHKDVKPGNILVKLDDQQNPIGFLMDFDLLSKIGYEGKSGNYCYWDKCANEGWVTPFCDVYGMAMILGLTVIPNFNPIFQKKLESLKNSEERTKLLNQIVVSYIKEIFQNKEDSLNRLSLDLGPFSTPIKIQEGIASYIKIYEKVLLPGDKFNLEALVKRIKAIEEVFNFIVEIVKNDDEVYKSLIRNEETKKPLRSDNSSTRGIKILDQEFKSCTMFSFLTELQKINQILK